MKKMMIKTGNQLMTGIFFGALLTLLSCGDRDKKDLPDETASVRTEATGTFGGEANTIDGNKLYTDFASTNYFEEWDRNRDNKLNKDEYASAFFSTWDTNSDNILDNNEWKTASNDFGFKANKNWDWSAWDANKDNKINKKEFNTQLANAGLFERWDKNNDNMLDEKEYSEGIHGMWNEADDDGVLDEEEYKVKFKKYYNSNQKKYMPEMG